MTFIDWADLVHLLGPPGTGKSHLAMAFAVDSVSTHRLQTPRPPIRKATLDHAAG